MSVLHAWRHRIRTALRSSRAARELQEEMDLYLELDAAELAHLDEDPRLARRRFGNATFWRERVWDLWRPQWLEGLARDVRHAVRLLRHRPHFALAALGVLTCGIAAGTTVFSMVPVLRAAGSGDVRFGLVLLLMQGVAVALVVVACSGAADLMLARTAERRTELAIRVAFGASHKELLRHLVIDAALIAFVAGGAAQVFAHLAIDRIRDVLPSEMHALVPGWRDLDAHGAVTVMITVLAVAMSALIATTTTLRNATIDTVSRNRASRRRASSPWPHLAAAAQISLTLAISGVAVLFSRSVAKLTESNIGSRVEGVWTMRARLPAGTSAEDARRWYVAADAMLRADPGVRDAGFVSHVPLSNADQFASIRVSASNALPASQLVARRQFASPGYFHALDITIERGRGFVTADTSSTRATAIVNRAFGQRFAANPVGQLIVVDGVSRTVIGVVSDVLHNGADDGPAPEVYIPMLERPELAADVVVVTGDTSASRLRTLLAAITPRAAIGRAEGMTAVRDRRYAGNRLAATVLSAFAVASVLITGFGLYGRMAQDIVRRRHEIRIRIAVGAGWRAVAGLVAAPIGATVATGTAAGVIAIGLIDRAARSVTFGVPASDPWTFAVPAAVLATMCLACCATALHQALRVDLAGLVRGDV